MTQKINGELSSTTGARTLIISLCMAVCVIWLYHQQLFNGFSVLAGDRYDGVISTTILEHWYNVFRGKANWAEVNYFFPHARSLANTDGYFIVGMIYSPFRAFGIDPFLSAEIANIVIKCIGFIGMYWMSRRIFSLPFHWALLAAVLFTLSNGMTTHSSRSQLATVAFAPFMAIFLWNAGKAVAVNNFQRARTYGIVAGLLFGAWCLTCFYAAWFFLYFFIAFGIIALICSRKSGTTLLKQQITHHAGSYLLVLAVALLSLGPFLYAFFPKSQETGVRNYNESLAYTVPVENILQLGQDNLFAGKLYNKVLLEIEPGYVPANEYYNTGFGIVLFILFVMAAIRIFRQERNNSNTLLLSFTLATVLTWLTTLNFHGHSLWFAVFHAVPGAKALRVVSAYNIFLALPIVVLSVRYLAVRKLSVPAAAVLTALLILEEMNSPALGLVRKTEMERVALSQRPPLQCQAFYTSGWRDQATLGWPAELYAHNVTAMFIAQGLDIPTINGIASFMAPDWDFSKPDKPDYDARVLSYASKNHLKGLCRLDLDSKTWQLVDPATIRTIPINLPLYEKSQWTGGIASYSGLSAPEPWGSWSNAKVIEFEFSEPLPPKFELHLTGHAFAHNNDKNFIVTLRGDIAAERPAPANVREFSMSGDKDAERIMRFDNPNGLRHISIVVPHPVSPLELGATSDDRTLGIALSKMSIVPL